MEKTNESIAQIEKDLHRTMPRNEYFDKEKDIPRLRSVLVAYSWINPYVSLVIWIYFTENGTLAERICRFRNKAFVFFEWLLAAAIQFRIAKWIYMQEN